MIHDDTGEILCNLDQLIADPIDDLIFTREEAEFYLDRGVLDAARSDVGSPDEPLFRYHDATVALSLAKFSDGLAAEKRVHDYLTEFSSQLFPVTK
jgi:hypothetical protein